MPALLSPVTQNIPTPLGTPGQKHNPQTPRRTNRTAGLPSARASPYESPSQVRLSNGVELKTPKRHMADKAASRRHASSMASPGMGPPVLPIYSPGSPPPARLTGGSPATRLFPRQLRFRRSSTSLAPAAIISTPKREQRVQDPSRPTVKLLRVLDKCWGDDTSTQMRWALKDGLLNGRGEELDRSGMWNTVGYTVGSVWPHLRGWIMQHIPSDDDIDWFTGTDRIGEGDEGYINDPQIATKHSSLERVGFFMSPKAYDTACGLVRALATRGTDFRQLAKYGVNPFFVIYAFADCGISLPDSFSRELLWKHLDAILEARCWRGLGSNHVHAQSSRSTNVTHGSSNSRHSNDDPESTIELLTLIHGNVPFIPKPESAPLHQLHIAINDNHWVATGVGTVWYEAQDLEDEDIAPFTVIDALTRVLPSCRGGTLEIRTNNVRLLWGVCGAPSGAWFVVRSICHSYSVDLRAKWDELRGLDPRLHAHPARGTAPHPPRDANIVNLVVEELGALKGFAAYRGMVDHLMRK